MAVPKRRKSKSKSRMRRSHDSIKMPDLRPCPNCGTYVLPHRVCPECQHYKGKLIRETKVKVNRI